MAGEGAGGEERGEGAEIARKGRVEWEGGKEGKEEGSEGRYVPLNGVGNLLGSVVLEICIVMK